VHFCYALFEGESAVRIIFSLSPRPASPARHEAKPEVTRLAQSLKCKLQV